VQCTAVAGRAQGGGEHQPGHADHTARWLTGSYVSFHGGHGGTSGGGRELGLAEHRWAPGHPGGGGDLGDLVEQLHRGDTGADDEDVLPARLLGTAVVGGVQLAAGEGGCSGVVRPERALPGAGGVDDGPAW